MTRDLMHRTMDAQQTSAHMSQHGHGARASSGEATIGAGPEARPCEERCGLGDATAYGLRLRPWVNGLGVVGTCTALA
jgi:hypothetical protein